jgi:hypothetical protein
MWVFEERRSEATAAATSAANFRVRRHPGFDRLLIG